jgi:hypothetical protein
MSQSYQRSSCVGKRDVLAMARYPARGGMQMRDVVLVAAGGAVGSLLRFWVGLLVQRFVSGAFP